MRLSKLTDWCDSQHTWVRDALCRVALTDEVTQADVDAVAIRVAVAHGIPVEGDHPCEAFTECEMKPTRAANDEVLLCSIGPLEGVDRLADDQELKFALDGVTLIFGDNASGKSGYARAARQLCHARVSGHLRGDVFADLKTQSPVRITHCHKANSLGKVVQEKWVQGDSRPVALGAITVLDTENARVYVEGENEILFLPPEVTCLTRLGKLYTLVGAKFQAQVDALTSANSGPFGNLYNQATAAGQLISRLTTLNTQTALPTELEIRENARWDQALDKELIQLENELAQSPPILSAKYTRLATAVEQAAKSIRDGLEQLNDARLAEAVRLIRESKQADAVAAAIASEQMAGHPISATGSDPWKTLYQFARQFAAEAGVRTIGQAFEIGDPCPLCQTPLDEESARRLATFDEFMKGKASADARTAATSVADRLEVIGELDLKSDTELNQLLSEYTSTGEDEERLTADTGKFNDKMKARKSVLITALQTKTEPEIEHLPESPIEALSQAAAKARSLATKQLERDGAHGTATVRAIELRDQKRLHDQLAEVLERRAALDLRKKLLACAAAVNTLPVSRLATAIRKELVTPELGRRINEEIEALSLTHIPLKLGEKTDRGTSFFEVALATDQRADKVSVLSEGEQRALSIACFLAESHVAGRKAGIIFDDPVTSLDHKRLRKVAERLAREAATDRQIIIFTHNMLFYQEMLRACVEQSPQVPVLPCVIRQYSETKFGIVTNNDQPWVAKKIKEREQHLETKLKSIPDNLPSDSEALRQAATFFYTDLRESWERAVEEILLNAVVERFGTDVKTQSLKGVQVTDEDYVIIFNAMKRASEFSGHDRAAGRQLDSPSKDQMRKDLDELRAFRATRQKRRNDLQDERKKLEEAPSAKTA